MSQLFEDSDSEVELKTDTEYAKNYDTWRKKEVLNKLKSKYGEGDEDDSSSSSDDEVGVELTEEVEEDFYKILASLKKKDPKIYDENAVFFDKSSSETKKKSKKSKENESMYLKDYERKLLLEKGGVLSDDENVEDENVPYTEEQKKLKESLKKVVEEEGSDTEEWGGMFKVRQENKEQQNKKEADYKAWLAGQKKHLDKETKATLRPLKDYWNDPNLEDGEKFLKDYILNKRYLEDENADYIPTYDEIVHDSDENLSEDENEIEKQEEFEHKYNFRFEEPDQEFIKRFPRTMEHSLRKEDDRRKVKRAETKERKVKEKAQKMEELQKLRDLKRKEIEEKIEKLKEITGNKEMPFKDADIDEDFDPEEHDKRMQALFNDEYYEGPEEDQKPKFDVDDDTFLAELETENFDNWTGNDVNEEDTAPHCEDDDFNMDADYDPRATQKELIENTKRKKKRRKKSKFVEMLAKDRPTFEPTDKTYEEYIDEYYKLDCEDIIDNIPCRFKYRKVAPNSFGLSIEEILVAKDRELNKWCSLKKALQLRPDHIEKYDQVAYSKKATNLALKKKILPSLFLDEEEVNENANKVENQETKSEKAPSVTPNKKKRKRNSNSEENVTSDTVVDKKMKKDAETANSDEVKRDSNEVNETNHAMSPKKKKKKGSKKTPNEISDDKIQQDIQKEQVIPPENQSHKSGNNQSKNKKKKKNKNKRIKNASEQKQNSEAKNKKGSAMKKNKNQNDPLLGFSDARLAAIGLNPKKFKNKVKYSKNK